MTDDKPTCDCESEEEHVNACITNKPTGLTDEQIADYRHQILKIVWTKRDHVSRSQADQIQDELIDSQIRRIEAIVQKDMDRYIVPTAEIIEKARKDERERAVKAALRACGGMNMTAHGYEIRDAILRGED